MEGECTRHGLSSHSVYPPLALLSDENEPSLKYYYDGSERGVFSHKRLWCFMGEIVEASTFLRPMAEIRTRFGELARIGFYHDNDEYPKTFSWSQLKPGHTLFVYTTDKHMFMDMSVGIRVEALKDVFILAAPQAQLIAESDIIVECCRWAPPPAGGYNRWDEHEDAESVDWASMAAGPIGPYACCACRRPGLQGSGTAMSSHVQADAAGSEGSAGPAGSTSPPSTTPVALQHCSKCRVAVYCSKDCQAAHWKGSTVTTWGAPVGAAVQQVKLPPHKALCKYAKFLDTFMRAMQAVVVPPHEYRPDDRGDYQQYNVDIGKIQAACGTTPPAF